MGNLNSGEERVLEQAVEELHSRIDEKEIEFECQRPFKQNKHTIEKVEISGDPSEPYDHLGRESVLKEGQDRRMKVDDTGEWPHCVQGLVEGKVGYHRSCLGSGTLIGPNLVLTCAHNVYRKDGNMEIDKGEIYFYPGMKGKYAFYSRVNVIEVYYPEEYKHDENEDYALLVLDRRIGYDTGYFGIKTNEEGFIDEKAHLYGYPCDMPNQNQDEHYLWGMEGSFKIDDYENIINHYIDTSPGQSGSALYVEQDDKYYIIGVHVRGKHRGCINCNQAVYLNRARINKIKGWIKAHEKKYISEIDSRFVRKGYEIVTTKWNGILDLSNLSVLKLVKCNLQSQHASKLAETDLYYLLVLDLSENLIGNIGAISLSKAKLRLLKGLYLSSNYIEDQGAEYLSESLRKLLYLNTLDLYGNKIGKKGVRSLLNNERLKTLDLYRNNIVDKKAYEYCKGNLIHITELNLSDIKISYQKIMLLTTSRYLELKELNLSNNEITDEGAYLLSRGSFPNLFKLDLSKNRIGDSGAEAISEATFINLSILYLSRNNIGDIGATALSRASFMNLTSLRLWNNKIGDEGAIALSQATYANLKELSLSNNMIGEIGAAALSQCKFVDLKDLNLSGIEIKAQECDPLSETGSRNLQTSSLIDTKCDDESKASLRRSLTKLTYIVRI